MTPLLVDIDPPGNPAVRFVAVPPASAGTAFFGPLAPALAPACQMTVLRLPGREDLWDDDPLQDAEEILARVVAELAAAPAGTLVLHGACTGGLLAYELAQRLVGQQVARPAALVLSGTPTPAAMGEPFLYESQGPELRDYYERAESEPFPDEVWELAEPRARADLAAVERCTYTSVPLAVPIITVRGADDDIVSRNETMRWDGYAGAGVDHRELAGGHFLMYDCPDALTSELLDVLRCYTGR